VALKVFFGAIVFAWMVLSGKLDLARVGKSLTHWPLILGIVAIAYGQVAITALRWELLLRAQSIMLPFRRAWGLTMIGMLFNVVIPGAVGGDLIKGYYIARANASRKSHAATSVLMDRVTGLIGLLILGGVMVLAGWNETMRTAATRSLGLLTVGGALGGLLGLYAAVFSGKGISGLTFVPRVLRNVFEALHEYRARYSVIPIALLLSVLNQTLSCAMYYLALRAVGIADMPVGQFFLVVPLGLVTTAIPLSPGGVGVGQAAFFALFQIVAPRYAAGGTDAMTVFQLMYILVCISGLYCYISYKHTDDQRSDSGL
jgi:uncharacterized membrane protein YbhN (UPF0104 family)